MKMKVLETELMRLKDVTEKAKLPIILKIGGVEAITDIYNALSIGVKGIITNGRNSFCSRKIFRFNRYFCSGR